MPNSYQEVATTDDGKENQQSIFQSSHSSFLSTRHNITGISFWLCPIII
jgi:hypothetical protein